MIPKISKKLHKFRNKKVTETKSISVVEDFAFNKLLDLSVKGIVDGLDLRRPIYRETARYGHFGRAGFPWEKIVKY